MGANSRSCATKFLRDGYMETQLPTEFEKKEECLCAAKYFFLFSLTFPPNKRCFPRTFRMSKSDPQPEDLEYQEDHVITSKEKALKEQEQQLSWNWKNKTWKERFAFLRSIKFWRVLLLGQCKEESQKET